MSPQTLHEQISTERLILRRHQLDLATPMFQAVDRDRERLGRFLPWVKWTKGIHDEREYIEMALRQWKENTMFDYGFFVKETGKYLGNLGVHTINWEHNSCELGYWIIGEAEGQGYVSESILALEKHLFDIGFFRIEIRCNGANKRSGAVAERCGYVLEGRLRKHLIENGQRRDTLIYAKLRGE